MKIFLDTNVFFDLLFNRTGNDQAQKIIQLIQSQIYAGFVADISLLNIDYVANKQSQDVSPFLYFIEQNFVILGADNRDILSALNLDNKDLEDNVQYILAKKTICSLIVSNDKSFPQLDIPVLDSNTFLDKYGMD